MFPAGRTEGEGLGLPPFDVVPREVAGCMEALGELQATCHAWFPRRAPRAHCFDSRGGQCSTLARKSSEPRALQGEGGTRRGRPRFLRAGRWEEAQRRWHDPQRVAAAMGAPAGVLQVEEPGCVKKGQNSVGVARHSCGPWGQVEHGQVGVCAGSASRQGDALGDQR
jgi:DDE superfamily endonuclease